MIKGGGVSIKDGHLVIGKIISDGALDANILLMLHIWFISIAKEFKDHKKIEAHIRERAKATGLDFSYVCQLLRAALTGDTASPPLFEYVVVILGWEETCGRIAAQLPSDIRERFCHVSDELWCCGWESWPSSLSPRFIDAVGGEP